MSITSLRAGIVGTGFIAPIPIRNAGSSLGSDLVAEGFDFTGREVFLFIFRVDVGEGDEAVGELPVE
jgi:hypothetical protein